MGTHVALITSCPMSHTNGIGVQLHTMVAEGFPLWHHFWFWAGWSSGESDVPQSTELGRSHRRLLTWWRWRRGRGFITRLARPLDPLAGGVRRDRFAQSVAALGKTFGAAYVAPLREEDALAMLGMVNVLGCPYVVHLWDLTHHEPCIDAATMPGFTRLLSGAEAVYCLTREMETWIAPVRRSDGLLAFGRRPPTTVASAPVPGQPLRLAVMGDLGIYRSGVELLRAAWPRLARATPAWRLVYLGPRAQQQVLAGIVGDALDYHGFVPNAERDRLLSTCHAAFLPGPSEDPVHELLARYSVPSRSSDYLLHGLPVLANLHPASAAHGFFADVRGSGMQIVRDADAMVAAAQTLSDPAAWQQASAAALAFGREHLDSRVLRDRIHAHVARHVN